MTHSTLIEKLRAADGPDRELDAEICVHLKYQVPCIKIQTSESNIISGNVFKGVVFSDSFKRDYFVNDEVQGCRNAPDLTASIDAALALVAEALPDDADAPIELLQTAMDMCSDLGWGVEKLSHAILIALFTALEGESA